MYAICETCEETVEAELTHNGVMQVGHYVHCGWGHMCAPEDLFESQSARKGSEKPDGLQSEHRGITQARSSEGGNDGKELPAVSIQSREPVDSNPVPGGAVLMAAPVVTPTFS